MKAKEYFVFTKRERSGIISLIILVLIVVVVPKYFDRRPPIADNIPIIDRNDTTTNDTIKKEKTAKSYKKEI
jgi:hypothetical protein